MTQFKHVKTQQNQIFHKESLPNFGIYYVHIVKCLVLLDIFCLVYQGTQNISRKKMEGVEEKVIIVNGQSAKGMIHPLIIKN